MATDGIALTIPVNDVTVVKWNDVHKAITDMIAGGTADNGVFNGGKWTDGAINKFKEQVEPAAKKFAEGEQFGADIKKARDELKTDLANANDDAGKVIAYEKHDKALNDANKELFTVGGHSKIGGSKRRGSKRGGKSRRRGSKSKSKRRKH